jgi:ankyrin repeat protein
MLQIKSMNSKFLLILVSFFLLHKSYGMNKKTEFLGLWVAEDLNETAIKEFLEKNASLVDTPIDDENSTPLMYAVARNNKKIVKLLLDNEKKPANPNLTRKNGETALHVACQQEELNRDIIELLIDHKVEINAEDSDGKRALDYVPENPEYETITNLLKKHKAERAFPEPNSDKTLRLLESFSSISFGTITKSHFSAIKEELEEVDLNVNAFYHPKSNKDNILGYTPLHYACIGASHVVTSFVGEVDDRQKQYLMRYKKFIELLIERGADVNYVNTAYEGQHRNKQTNTLEVAKWHTGTTPLGVMLKEGTMYRFSSESNEIIELLLKKGAKVDLLGHGHTPWWEYLTRVNLLSKVNTIKLLLVHGANPDIKNKDGKSLHDIIKVKVPDPEEATKKNEINAQVELLELLNKSKHLNTLTRLLNILRVKLIKLLGIIKALI